jgi:hypothetical protein
MRASQQPNTVSVFSMVMLECFFKNNFILKYIFIFYINKSKLFKKYTKKSSRDKVLISLKKDMRVILTSSSFVLF